MKRTYPGVNGRAVAIDLARVEALLDEGGETHLFTSADWYRVGVPFAQVEADWLAADARVEPPG